MMGSIEKENYISTYILGKFDTIMTCGEQNSKNYTPNVNFNDKPIN